ncbi:MAG: Calx-beta domain-containing protein, partial [Planctomycetota bacterium]
MKNTYVLASLFLCTPLFVFCTGALAAPDGVNEVEPMPGYVFLGSSVHNVTEGSGQAKLTVSQWGGSIDTFSVDYTTADGSAVAGQDYRAASGTLHFGSGIFTRDILIPLIDDTDPEGVETFTVTLSGRHAFSPTTCTVTISDDDVADVVWHSYDMKMIANPVYSETRSRATVTDQAGVAQARVELYESSHNGGVGKSTRLSTFNARPHDTFPDVRDYWNNGGYPHVGKSSIPRGDDTNETNTPLPTGVLDISVHPPDNDHLIVTAFVVPLQGNYVVSDLAVRRLVAGNCGQQVRLSLFDQNQNRLASLEAGIDMNDGAWVVDREVYTLGHLEAGDRIYFGVERVDDFYGDAAEIVWTITRGLQAETSAPAPVLKQSAAQAQADHKSTSMDEVLRDFWDSEYSRLTMRRNQARAIENPVPILIDGKVQLRGRPSFPYLD